MAVRRGAGGGAYASAPSPTLVSQSLHRLAQLGQFDSEQLYAARRLLEPGIVAEAAARATPERLAPLEAVLAELRGLAAAGRDTGDASLRFHLLLAEATGNALLVLLAASLLELAERLDSAIPHRPRPVRLVVDEHAALLEAIKRGDAESARRLASEHLAELGRQTVAEQVRARGAPSPRASPKGRGGPHPDPAKRTCSLPEGEGVSGKA